MSLQVQINARINKIGTAEKVTKRELGLVSRELLTYLVVDDSGDIGAVNRLLNVLTRRNQQVAVLFFNHFLPYAWDDKEKKFKGKVKQKKRIEECSAIVDEFLSDEANDIWKWDEDNNEDIQAKPKDYAKKIKTLVEKALKDQAEGLSPEEILQVAFDAMEEIPAEFLLKSLEQDIGKAA